MHPAQFTKTQLSAVRLGLSTLGAIMDPALREITRQQLQMQLDRLQAFTRVKHKCNSLRGFAEVEAEFGTIR